MATLTPPVQAETSRPTTPRVISQVLSQSNLLSTASSIIQTYPSITSAYLFGSYAKGTARPDSDIDIAIFIPDLKWDKLADIGGVKLDLEDAFDKDVDLSVCPPLDFVERVKKYWVPINLGCNNESGTQEDNSSSASNQSHAETGISQSPSTTVTVSSRSGDPSVDTEMFAIDASTRRQLSSPPSPPPPTPMENAGEAEAEITFESEAVNKNKDLS